MLRLALRQLQLDPVRASLTVIALGSVLCVILVLKGFEQGQYYQNSRIVLNRNADLIGLPKLVVIESERLKTLDPELSYRVYALF